MGGAVSPAGKDRAPDMVEDISPRQAWDALLNEPGTQLVDVRTEAEWQHIGLPDLGQAGKQPVLVSWQLPTGAVNLGFIDGLLAAGLQPDQRLLFLCRSGVRSLAAAEAARHAGFPASVNVADGFEGHPDARGRRGTTGWKAEGLPWQQSLYRA